jgi:hypothetical protein
LGRRCTVEIAMSDPDGRRLDKTLLSLLPGE